MWGACGVCAVIRWGACACSDPVPCVLTSQKVHMSM